MSIHKITGKTGTRYQVKLRDPNGRQYSKTFRTRSEAKSYETSQINSMQRGSWTDVRLSVVTFGEFADLWVNQNKQKRQRTLDRDIGILRLHVLPVLGNTRISNIKKIDIQNLVNGWTTYGLKPRTVRRNLAVVKAIFQKAIEDELLFKNPATGTKYPKPDPVEQHPLTSEESTALLSSIQPFYKPLLYIAITTGLRWSELAGLQIRDIVLMGKEPALHVNRGLHATSKGTAYEQPKSNAGKRTIPLTQTQVELIASHIAETKRTMIDGGSPLFVSPEGHALNYSNFRSRVFVPALEKAGISKTRIHDLRRTTATILVANQVDLKTIEQLMGHSDIRMTLSVYASATQAGMDKALVSLEDHLNPPPNSMTQLG